MFRYIVHLLLLSIILATSLHSESSLKNLDTEIEYFTKNSANNLYNLNEVEVKNNIKILFKNEAIKAVDVKDALSGETFVKAYKSGDKIILNKPFPKDINLLTIEKKSIKHDAEEIGKVIIYYSNIEGNALKLTKDEINWLQKHPVLKASSEPDYAPWDFNVDGVAKGYSVDYLNLLASKIGIKVEYVHDTWNNLVQKLEDKKIDIIHTMFKNDARKKIIYSNQYKKVTVGIYVHKDNEKLKSASDLTNELVSITKGDSSVVAIQKKYPNIRLSLTDTYLESLKEVTFNKSDAVIIEPAVGNYLIKAFNIPNLKILDEFDAKDLGIGYAFHFGVNKDNAILASILNKAMYSLKTSEIDAIDKKWLSFGSKVDYTLILEILAVVFLVILGFVYNNRKLKQLVNEKTAELQSLLSSFDKNVIASSTDEKGVINYVSDALCEISGYSRDELIGKQHNILRHPDMPKELFADLWASIKTNQVWKGEIKNRKKDGGYYWVDAVISPEHNSKSELIGYSAIRQDITAKKAVEELIETQAEQMAEIERSNRLLSGRENKMVELKSQINECRIELGEEAPYAIVNTEDITIEENIDLKDEAETDLKVLLDVEQLQVMMENFHTIMHIPLAIIDLKGNILVQSKWQRACTDFHRVNEESCKRCIESDIDLASKLDDGERFTSYKCKNGLIDCASPIIINGEHVANFFIGQFLINEPDMQYFKNQAKLFGYDEKDYLDSIKDVTIVKEEMLPHILGFLTGITDVVTSISIEKLKAQKNENINKIRAVEMQKGQIAAMNLAEDAEKARLEIENYKEHLETLVEERTEELNEQKQFVQTLLDSQEQIIVTTDGTTIVTANQTFFKFFEVVSIPEFIKEYKANCICGTFNTHAPEGYLQIMMDDEKWIDYIIARSGSNFTHKAMITRKSVNYIFSVTAAILPGNKGLKSAVLTNITAIETAKQEVEAIHKHTKESIEYASLIQSALVPDNDTFKNYFSDFFTIWQPKDIVGGDIYLFEELRDRDECLLMVIDCTGHGVPGAFVTMLVKAIERQVIAKIENDRNIDVSPAWILSYFNRTMKKLLHQDSEDTMSNAGFDGGIVYYNKKEKILKYAGAETALFYIDEVNELKTIKGSRQSIGYKKSDINFEFKEHVINLKDGMVFYITTDGYVDQNGGEKGFPLGKKKFSEIILNNYNQSFSYQKELLLNLLAEYQGNENRNDDVTLIGLKI